MRAPNGRRVSRGLVAITALGVILAACGGEDATETTTGGTTETTTASTDTTAAGSTDTTAAGTDTTAAITEEEYRVALIYPGTADDLSWSNAWFDGAEQVMEANPNITVESVELLNDPAAVVQQGSAFASQGFDFIMIAHGAMVEPAVTLAQQFPEVQFCLAPHHPDGSIEQPDNLCWVDPAQHNANFLAGALAALVSETGHVASLNGFAFPGLTRQPEAFNLGARCVNPDIVFTQQYIQTWTDTGIAKSAGQAEIAGGADVILAATDSAVFGVLEAAAEASETVWVVPSYYESQSLDPEHVLTSAIHGLTFTSKSIIEMAASGSIAPQGFVEFDATNNPEIDAPLYDSVKALLSPEELTQYEGIVEAVRTGAIAIPDETTGDVTIGAEGSGATVDLAAIGCA